MAEQKMISTEDIRVAVVKDSSTRLQDELLICFPSMLKEDLVRHMTRAELIDKVGQCRSFLKQTGKSQTSLEGKLVLLPMSVEEETVATDPMMMMMMKMFKMQQDREDARIQSEREDRREREKKEEERLKLEHEIMETRLKAEQQER